LIKFSAQGLGDVKRGPYGVVYRDKSKFRNVSPKYDLR